MKMETVIPAPFAARVRELLVATGGQVETGMPLVRLEPLADDESGTRRRRSAAGAGPALDLPDVDRRPPARLPAPRALLADLRSMLLGFDVAPADRTRDPGGVPAAARRRAGRRPARCCAAELDVVTVFADLCELTRNRPAGEETSDERVHSPREYFHSYLHSLDVDRERLPDAFRTRLARVLAHYGVTDLDRSPALEEAVFRIFLAQQRTRRRTSRVVTALLQHWLDGRAAGARPGSAGPRRPRPAGRGHPAALPVVGDLARSARFRWFDQPRRPRPRGPTSLAGVRDELAYLSAHPDAADYAERLEALAAIPEPIVRFLAERLERGIPEREPMLEVLARRHYREHELHDLRSLHARRPAVRHLRLHARRPADPAGDHASRSWRSSTGRPTRVASSPRSASWSPRHLPATRPSSTSTCTGPARRTPPTRRLGTLQAVLGSLPQVQRRTPGSRGRVPGRRDRPVTYFTFRPGPDRRRRGRPGPRACTRWSDAGSTCGGCATSGSRRLEAPEDVLLYHCVAPDNESDQRLVALAQVRELAIVRDAGRPRRRPCRRRSGPSLHCLEAIRRARAARGAAGRAAGHEPRLPAHLAGDRRTARRSWPRCSGPRAADGGRRDRGGRGAGPHRGARRLGAPGVALRFSYQRRGGRRRVRRRRRRPSGWRRWTTTRRRCCARGAAARPTRTSWCRCSPGRPAPSPSTTSTTPARWCRWTGRPAGTRPGSSSGVADADPPRYPEGITRVALLGDPTKALGTVAEAECARVVAALDLAE